MAHIVVIGAGIGGLPTAYELRKRLSSQHRVTIISDTPFFTFIPSLPWVALGLKQLSQVQLKIEPILRRQGIEWVQGKVKSIDPYAKELIVGDNHTLINYDYVVIATGASLNLQAIPGLGPEHGYTQSVCNPHHATLADQAWQKFLDNPGPLVIGAVPGASCFGPAYEFALLAEWRLRKLRKRSQVPITLITSEPYVGHLGIGGMSQSQELVEKLLKKQQITVIENAAITKINPSTITLADGHDFPFEYAMILPSFQGPEFLRSRSDLADAKGFIPVLPTYQHPDFDSIYAAGVVVKIQPPEQTPIPTGVPKTGQMTEAMGMAVAHNLAVRLGEHSGSLVTPTLAAICITDFGDRGIVFIADQVLPDPVTGKRRRSVALEGRWVSWAKTLFEQFFLTKMRLGMSVPWFEQWGLKILGLDLVEPIEDSSPLRYAEIEDFRKLS
ncbi:MAG: sulfide:quinone reductase [Gloeocapsa sp. DLM2.Bin57]|nr:MAG: sulfide:quinone reductase [Gloeocapsa sp. DLM2.Bin57]